MDFEWLGKVWGTLGEDHGLVHSAFSFLMVLGGERRGFDHTIF